jgi:hypothetical protein
LAGAFTRHWKPGLVLGAALHALVFVKVLDSSDWFRLAPTAVTCWVLAVGIIAGGMAGGHAGLISQVAAHRNDYSNGRPAA